MSTTRNIFHLYLNDKLLIEEIHTDEDSNKAVRVTTITKYDWEPRIQEFYNYPTEASMYISVLNGFITIL